MHGMKHFSDIIGQEDIISHFQHALKVKQVSHAYIISGEKGMGKKTLANAFAKALVCEAGYGDACKMCRSCLQFDSGNHPDVRYVLHEKPGSIGVDDVRTQITGDIMIKPYNGRYKVYIVDEAELMTPQAQNALLKSIEEPPAYAVLIFLTQSPEALLPTIRSRCILIRMKPVDSQQIRQYLMREMEIPDYRAAVCSAYAQGNLGKAITMAASEDFREMHDLMLYVVKRVDEMHISDMTRAIHDISRYKAQIQDFLDLMAVWYRDVLTYKATQDADQIIYQGEVKSLQKKAASSSYEGLGKIQEAISDARYRLKANASFDWTMELLLVHIKEN